MPQQRWGSPPLTARWKRARRLILQSSASSARPNLPIASATILASGGFEAARSSPEPDRAHQDHAQAKRGPAGLSAKAGRAADLSRPSRRTLLGEEGPRRLVDPQGRV